METSSITSHDGKRKRGFRRACFECKRRRLCVDEHQPDNSSQANSRTFGSDRPDQDGTCSKHVAERLTKLEQLFERFVCRKFTGDGASFDASRSPTLTTSIDSEKDTRPMSPPSSSQRQSMSPIGDGILGAQKWGSAPSTRTLVDTRDIEKPTSYDAVQRSLIALLPSQHDADIIFESSNGWMILNGIYRASQDIYVNRDPQSYALDMQAVAKEPSIIVARTLLHMAICINSLPPEFDHTRLSMWNLDATMQNYVSTVVSRITSSDEQLMTLHGLEVLVLLAFYHMNNAALRQAWLMVRRGLNLAHLMGFHRIIMEPDLNPPIPGVSNAKEIWRKLVDTDRYLGLHLRLPFGADDYPLHDDADLQQRHKSKINTIMRQVVELDRDVSPQGYSAALALDETMESLMRELPKDFWEVPNIPSTAKSPESLAVIDRLMVQMWHFEMKIFIHLPYLLRASQESRYDYSKVTALQASRNVLMRWFALRNAAITQACCRFAELGVFIAAITLTLDIVIELGTKEKSEVQKTKGTDFAMLCRLISEMEKLAKTSAREKIAGRSAIVLKKILSSLDPSKQPSGKARMNIPFFGCIDLEYKKPPVRPGFAVESDAGRIMKATATSQHVPTFSFVHNALWPKREGDSESEFDWNIVLFDGLEDKDTDGNWVF
ncbi:hypothetical protein ACN47E_000123 [Coniothyrium glycines]